jgi:hypothetical protein
MPPLTLAKAAHSSTLFQQAIDVCFGSLADMTQCQRCVRFTPDSRR